MSLKHLFDSVSVLNHSCNTGKSRLSRDRLAAWLVLWRHCRCGWVDFCQGCQVVPMRDHITCGETGRDAGLECQCLQLCIHCRCNVKPK